MSKIPLYIEEIIKALDRHDKLVAKWRRKLTK